MSNYRNYKDFSQKTLVALSEFRSSLYYAESRKAKKVEDAFNLTISRIEELIEEIEDIDKLLDNFEQMVATDLISKSKNKSAQKFVEEKKEIVSKISEERIVATRELLEQIQLAYKQGKNYRSYLEKDDKQFFDLHFKKFESLAGDVIIDKSNIPLSRQSSYEKSPYKSHEEREHEEEEKKIDNASKTDLKVYEDLEQKLDLLGNIMVITKDQDLKKAVNKEVLEIKKFFSPKVMQASRETVEKLRNSNQLILDLEQMTSIVEHIYGFGTSKGKLGKLSKKIENLKPLLQQALEEEKRESTILEQEKNKEQVRGEYAKDAVFTYSEILKNNDSLQEQQESIRSQTSSLHKSNEFLESEIKHRKEDIKEIDDKGRYKDYFDELKKEELRDRISGDREKIQENNRSMGKKLQERAISMLPPEYTEMKKRLQEVSNFNTLNAYLISQYDREGVSR